MGKRGPVPGPVNHGTVSGWQTHRNRGEVPCRPCKDAKNADNRLRSKGGKCAPGLGWPLLPGTVNSDA